MVRIFFGINLGFYIGLIEFYLGFYMGLIEFYLGGFIILGGILFKIGGILRGIGGILFSIFIWVKYYISLFLVLN